MNQVFEQRNESIQNSTQAVHRETTRIVDEQMQQMAVQMEALDDFVTRARSQNGSHNEAHLAALERLTKNIKDSFTSLEEGFGSTHTQLNGFQDLATQQGDDIKQIVTPFSEDIRQPLIELRTNIQNATMAEYKPTGTTPPRTSYEYPKILPRTESRANLIERMRQPVQPPVLTPLEEETLDPGLKSPLKHRMGSPVKTRVYNDAEDEVGEPANISTSTTSTAISSSNAGLREIDINVVAKQPNFNHNNTINNNNDDINALCVSPELPFKSIKSDNITNHNQEDDDQPPLKKQQTVSDSKLPQKAAAAFIRRAPSGIVLEGRENTVPLNVSVGGRRLRSRPSSG